MSMLSSISVHIFYFLLIVTQASWYALGKLQVFPNVLPIILTAFVAIPLFEPAGEIDTAPVVGDGDINHLLVRQCYLAGAIGSSERGFQLLHTHRQARIEVAPAFL